MKRRKTTRKDKLQYWFDNLMAKGTISMVGILFVITVVVVVLAGILAVLLGCVDADIFGSIWISLMHAVDAGTLAGDAGSLPFMLLMTLVTVCGLFITSVLIGIINAGMEAKMEELRKGKSCVLEEGHTVILGFDGSIYTILSELIEANANQKDGCIVIMDDTCGKDEMEEAIRQRIPDTKTTRIICRSGNITDMTDLRICSLEYARSIIINVHDDFLTIKAILAVTNLLKEAENQETYAVAVIREKKNYSAALIAAEGRAEVLFFEDTIARIISHTSRQSGLSKVFTELFDYGGDEIYLEEIPQMTGKRMAELNLFFPVSTVLGIERAGRTFLNPAPEMIVEAGDRLILLAEDDGVSVPMESPAKVQEQKIRKTEDNSAESPQKMLILGYGPRLAKILEEQDKYMVDGSQIRIAVQQEFSEQMDGLAKPQLSHIKTEWITGDLYDSGLLRDLISWEPESVLVMSSMQEDTESDDARTLLLLLQLRALAREKNMNFSVTSEMNRVENQELAQITEVRDFVISSNITSLMITQISQERDLRGIFEELLTEEGSELYMRAAGDYVKLGEPVDMYTAGAAAALKNQVLVGYRRKRQDELLYDIVTNPKKDSVVTFEAEDRFIVLSED